MVKYGCFREIRRTFQAYDVASMTDHRCYEHNHKPSCSDRSRRDKEAGAAENKMMEACAE